MIEKTYSVDGLYDHKIFVISWKPDQDCIKGIIHIIHGMVEHSVRYKSFAKALVEQNYAVYAHDHRGHGQSIKNKEDLGFFCDHEGFNTVVEDVKKVNEWIKKREPNKAILIFGHSMGSFITRRYIQLHGSSVKGAIISGTGDSNGALGKVALGVSKTIAMIKGKRYRSELLNHLVFGAFNKNFKPNRTDYDWLSRDPKQVDLYIKDKRCGFNCTAGFYVDLFTGMVLISKKRHWKQVPNTLPLLIISGDRDPVGDFGKGVQNVYNKYKTAGCNVTLMLFREGRHELINEINRLEVYQFILNWIKTVF